MRTATTPTRRWLRRAVAGGALAGVLAVVIVGSGIAAAKAKPVNNTAPKIFGAAKVGQVQTGDRGDWTNVNTYAYAWLRCNATGNGAIRSVGPPARSTRSRPPTTDTGFASG